MTTTLRVKRRSSGAAGAPASLKTGEIAANFMDGLLYIGAGDDGGGNATSVVAFAKTGFDAARFIPAGGTTGQALVKTGTGDYAVAWGTISAGGTYTAGTGLTLTGSTFAADLTVLAPLASPGLTGTPTAPTAAGGTNTTQIATTAYVRGEISTLLGGAGAAYDTLKELQDLIVADESTATALATTVGGKLTKTSNLSDLSNAGTARTNLGLGTMATQAASAVAITGGTIDGVTLDGGTF